MKKKEKQGLIILMVVAIVIIGIIWFVTRGNSEEQGSIANSGASTEYVEEQEDGTKVNTSNKVKETKEIEGVSIENIRITEKNGQTMLVADITNTTNQTKERFLVDVVLYNAQGNEMGRIPGVIGEMQAGETIEMQAGISGIDENYINTYNFKIEKKQ